MKEMSEWEILARQIVEDGFSREGLVNRITAELCLAEERGRQSAEDQAEHLLGRPVLEVASDLFEQECIEANKPAPPCEWADLAGLEGRELRERLRSRAAVFKGLAIGLERAIETGPFPITNTDIQIVVDLIYAKELAVTREFERLWSEHVDSYEKYLGTDDGLARICADLGPQYVGIIVHRATAKKVRAAAEYPVVEGTVVS